MRWLFDCALDACDLGSVLVVRRHGSCLSKGPNLDSISVNYSEVRGGVAVDFGADCGVIDDRHGFERSCEHTPSQD